MIILEQITENKQLYTGDVSSIMEEAVRRYGAEEWKINVIANEMHGHLGIYTLIGAKMGLYAREILGAVRGEIKVTSFAGLKPPVSCFNDGLQVGTGATLGHGLIQVAERDKPWPAAVFKFHENTVKISLREATQHEIAAFLGETLQQSGGLTEEYWKKVREQAIVYWLRLDRKQIFEIME